MAELQQVSMNNNSAPRFGMLLDYKAAQQKTPLINNNAMNNPLFAKFEMPTPGIDGNIFG